MLYRQKIWLLFVLIIAILGISLVIDYPKGPDLKIGNYFKEIKLHLGLDLLGGTHLVYDADTSQVPNADKIAAVEGVRDVIERRINAFGVSEPLVQTNQSGDKSRIIIELAGIQDINQAIKMIGETPLLEFKEEKSTELTEDEINQANATTAGMSGTDSSANTGTGGDPNTFAASGAAQDSQGLLSCLLPFCGLPGDPVPAHVYDGCLGRSPVVEEERDRSKRCRAWQRGLQREGRLLLLSWRRWL